MGLPMKRKKKTQVDAVDETIINYIKSKSSHRLNEDNKKNSFTKPTSGFRYNACSPI